MLATGAPEELDIGPSEALGLAPSDPVESTPLEPLNPVGPPLVETPVVIVPASSAQTQSPKPLPFGAHTW